MQQKCLEPGVRSDSVPTAKIRRERRLAGTVCAVDTKFIDSSNFSQLSADLSYDPVYQAKIKTPADMTADMKRMANRHERMRAFWKQSNSKSLAILNCLRV